MCQKVKVKTALRVVHVPGARELQVRECRKAMRSFGGAHYSSCILKLECGILSHRELEDTGIPAAYLRASAVELF